MSIDLYYFPLSPPSRAVLVTAKHLEIDVNLKELDLLKGEQLKEEFLSINPCHTVPTIVEGDFVLWESKAIMQYLCNQYAPDSPLYPSEPQKRAIVDRMLFFDADYYASIHKVVYNKFKGKEVLEQDVEQMKKTVNLLETLIGQSRFMAGDELTIADYAIGQTTSMLAYEEWKDIEECPNIKEWFQRLKEESNHFRENIETTKELFENFIASQKNDE